VINGTNPVAPKSRKRVLEAIEKTGYRPNIVAKNLRMKRTNTIGVLVEDVMAFPTSGIINGISEYMEKTNYHILLSDLRMLESLDNSYDKIVLHKEKIRNALHFLVYGTRVCAIIYIGLFDRDITGIIENMSIPVVVAYSISKDEHTSFVTYDNEVIFEEITQSFFTAGHENIAVITGLENTAPTLLRLKGIRSAFDRVGLSLNENLVKRGSWDRDSGYTCMKEIFAENPQHIPTAVIVMNDIMAIGAMDAIREAKLVIPDDISISGFDNRTISSLIFPRLTTGEINHKKIGYTAARTVAEQLADGGDANSLQRIIIPSNLISRDTVRNIKK
jgi:LacI family transcriptional regulator